MTTPWTLAIDFGTTNTSATYTVDGGTPQRVRLSSNSDSMPSAVLVDTSGIRVGDSALHARRVRPQAFVEAPKALLGQGVTHVAGEDHEVSFLVGRVLAYAARAAGRAAGSENPDRVVLTHPQDWASRRREALVDAWRACGVEAGRVELVSEPVAAASWLVSRPHVRLAEGARVAVVDYGGGTCDVSVLRWTGASDEPWVELGSAGAPHVGGMAVDQALLSWVREALHRRDAGSVEESLAAPENFGALRTLLDEVRQAKEVLSESDQADIPVAVGTQSTWVSITAEEFERVIAGEIAKVRALTERALTSAGVSGRDLDTLFLTGGSSLMRPVHTAMSEILGQRPATLDDPKMVVALGAAIAPTTEVPVPLPNQPEPGPEMESTAPEAPPAADPEPEPSGEPDSHGIPEAPPEAETEEHPSASDEPPPVAEPEPTPAAAAEPTPGVEPEPARVDPAAPRSRRAIVIALAAVAAVAVIVVVVLVSVLTRQLPPPTGLSADTSSSPGEVRLHWNPVDGADRYRVCMPTTCLWVDDTEITLTPETIEDRTYRVASATADDTEPDSGDDDRWATVSATAEPVPTTSQGEQLVARFGDDFVDTKTCHDPDRIVAGVVRFRAERDENGIVAAQCTSTTDADTTVTVLQFAADDALTAALAEQEAENDTGSSTCEGGNGTWSFTGEGEGEQGQLRCLDLGGGEAAVVWTYAADRIMVIAEGFAARSEALAWWEAQALRID
ncbi:Hsp70 family protein [Oryzobacter telluris]|uniref:Hsp70 family protein n=1 Tax=Oryzobacter telluris TaxID=3149179 RepID=UPI00370DBE4C